MASIKDVAKIAEVSVTTVSRALNNHPYVSEETKQKIYRVMKELDYFPNTVAQQLRGHKARTVGVIITDLTNPFFAYLVDAIEHTVTALNYRLVILQTRGRAELEHFYVELIQKKQLDGLIITNLEETTPLIDQLIIEGKIILCNRYRGQTRQTVIGIDEEQASYEGTDLLLQHRHRKIAYCTAKKEIEQDDRFTGFLNAHRVHDCRFDPLHYYTEVRSIADGRRLIQELDLDCPYRPTAFFTNSDEVAAGMVSEAGRLGIPIPDSLSILGFDDQMIASLTQPEITTIRQPIQPMGEQAARQLIGKLEKFEEDSDKAAELTTELIIRKTVGYLKGF